MQAAVIFSIRPLSGFPAPSPAPQANPAFPIWSCGTLHKNFSFFIGKWFFGIKKQSKRARRIRRALTLWRREGDSNPRDGIRRQHDFQSCTFNRSDTSPRLFPDLSVSALLICISG